jgi:hypothetical protein
MSDIFDMADAWNNGDTTFRAIRMSVVDTGSADDSLLCELIRNGASYFSVTKRGATIAAQFISRDGYFSLGVDDGGLNLRSVGQLCWSGTGNSEGAKDIGLFRVSAGVLGIREANLTTAGALNFLEQTAPSAPGANQVTLFAEDNGGGKTRLMARFNTGAAQQMAVEP